MKHVEDGIYFGMPEDEYLEVERLSKSGIKKIRISPADFWQDSFLNPNPPKLTPEQERYRAKAKMRGRAYHAARLEPDRFATDYVRELGQEEMPAGTLFTSTEIKEALKEKGLKQTGAVLEQATRLHEEGGFPRELLWHLAFADWEAGVPEGAIRLDATTYDEIAVDGARLHALPAVHDLLTGGAAEVSVFWTCPDSGIPMKARIDYLRPDRWVELKTFSNPNGKNLMHCIMDAIRFNRYHIDVVSYLHAIDAISSPALEIKGECTEEELWLVESVKERGGLLDCHLLFQQTGGVPNILERRFRFYEPDRHEEAIKELERDGASEDHLARARRFKEIASSERTRTAVHIKARMEIKRAKEDFLAYSEIYERGEPWLPFQPSGEITDDDFHPNWLESV